jgi:hypothetical protein
MAIETLPSNASVKKLVSQWAEAKDREKKAQETRLNIEQKLYGALVNDIPDKGSVRVEGLTGLTIKITCGFTDKWDQDQLQDIRANWDESLPPFPFREELRPEGSEIKYIRENYSQAYKLIEPALTQDPRKPSFSLD